MWVKLYEITLDNWGDGSIETLMNIPLPKLNELQNGQSHYGDINVMVIQNLYRIVLGWEPEQIQYDSRWTKLQ